MRPKDIFGSAKETGGETVREQIHEACVSGRSSEHQREMSFLRHLMLYDETAEPHELERKLTQAERNERCARRAVWLMGVLTGLAVTCLGYAAILLEDFQQNRTQLMIRILCALGLASLISLLGFLGFWLVARGELNVQRDGCRRLVTRMVEARLGKPSSVSMRAMIQASPSRDGATVERHTAAAASG